MRPKISKQKSHRLKAKKKAVPMYSVQYVLYDPRTLVEREAGEYGKHPALVRFTGNTISIRRPDGSLVTTGTLPYTQPLGFWPTVLS